MASGLLALLDDVAALVKASAVSLDDISAQVAKTSSKVSGVVIDDAAVTPKYVVGLDPKRELSIIYRIARSSLINKFFLLAPAALVLGHFASWAITPILMLGGTYLCVEGYEKVHGMLFPEHPDDAEAKRAATPITPGKLEAMRIASAVRTDLILSAEIIAITYSTVVEEPLLNQIAVLASVAAGITLAVYGFVGLVVKADDVGLHLAKTSRYATIRRVGVGLVKGMPAFLKMLALVGTAAMLWVGAEIIAHGIPFLHHALEALQHTMHQPLLAWLAKVLTCATGGLLWGGIVAQAVHAIQGAFARKNG